ncbi:MAG: hypothetical protein JSR48_00340 [Verrucomicrobia bacterium]|nr:hypothetical protein [Verrucomicrobiota bacterium]
MDLRFTETNGADDAAGRAFGLEGNLYLPVAVAGLGGIAGFALLGLGLGLRLWLAGAIGLVPVTGVTAWILVLRKGRPRGHDRDQVEAWLGQRHFGPGPGEGRR